MMIDWDEFLEDVNWGKWIAIIVGLILVGLDFSRANNLKTLLQSDLDQFNHFEATVAVPGEKDMTALQTKKEELAGRLAKDYPNGLPESFDLEAVKAVIEQTAARNGVEVKRVSLGRQTVDGYALVYPIDVDFTGSSGGAISFLSAIRELPSPHKVIDQPIRPGGVMNLTVEFYSFDKASFDQNYNCNTKIAYPDIPIRDVNLDDIWLFQSQVEGLKAEVDRKWAGINSTKKKFEDSCALEVEVETLAQKLDILSRTSK